MRRVGKALLWILGIGLALLLLLVLTVGVAYRMESLQPGFLKADARVKHARFMASGFQLVTPPGPGPFPTILLIPGCGGITGDTGHNPVMDEYARSAVEAGWAAAILDSYGPRKWAPRWARDRVCAGLRLPGLLRAADVVAGLDLMRADPRVDFHHVRIAGWSHGGWAVGDLLTLPDPGDGSFTSTMANVEGVQLTYPFCDFPALAGRRPWTWAGELRLVLAGGDIIQKPAGCMPVIRRAREAGAVTQMTLIPGVTHAFDEQMQTPTSPFKYNAAAAARAHAAFVVWLKTPLPPGEAPPRPPAAK
jgi:dienelactone hydrolase